MTADDFKAFRARQGWSQPQCAKALATSVATVRAIEQGRQRITGPLELLAELYAARLIPDGYAWNRPKDAETNARQSEARKWD